MLMVMKTTKGYVKTLVSVTRKVGSIEGRFMYCTIERWLRRSTRKRRCGDDSPTIDRVITYTSLLENTFETSLAMMIAHQPCNPGHRLNAVGHPVRVV